MLYTIPNLNDPLIDLVKDDPVRPSIPTSSRIHDHAEILVLLEDGQPQAVVCVAYLNSVPTTETELGQTGDNVAAFYTIWSYQPRGGRKLIIEARKYIRETRSEIKRFVTLSPKTEMARRFHLANGATVLSDNETTINYEYNG
jgi:hypothetical protein